MCDIVEEYFHNLFMSKTAEVDQNILADVNRRITSDINSLLIALFTGEEVKKALFQIGDLKAPGPDGMHAIFYKKILGLVGRRFYEGST
jgi:hypothetical protein